MLRVANKVTGLSAPTITLMMAKPVRRNCRLWRNPMPLPRELESHPGGHFPAVAVSDGEPVGPAAQNDQDRADAKGARPGPFDPGREECLFTPAESRNGQNVIGILWHARQDKLCDTKFVSSGEFSFKKRETPPHH